MERPKKNAPSRASADGSKAHEEEHLCSTCQYATPVTDKFLNHKKEPTLARCEFRKYMVLWRGKCEEKNIFNWKDKWKRKK